MTTHRLGTAKRSTANLRLTLAATLLLFGGFLVVRAPAAHAATDCTTYPSAPECVQGNTVTPPTITVTPHYDHGNFSATACGYPAAGIPVNFSLNGGAAGTGTTVAGGCASVADPICLPVASYTVGAVSPGYPTATATLTVTDPGCVLGASVSRGSLAFTGSNLLRLLALALLLLAMGSAITYANRRRRGVVGAGPEKF